MKRQVIAALKQAGRHDLADAVAAPLPRFTVETKEAGVVVRRDGSVVRVTVYSPLANIGKRGERVNRHHMELHCSPDDAAVSWGAKLRQIDPGWSAARVVTYVLAVMREATEQSIAAGHQFPTEFVGPITRPLKAVDPEIPDPGSVDGLEDRRGRDIVIRFTKPKITIVSLRDARDAQRTWEQESIQVSWYFHQRVGNLADTLVRCRGLDEVEQILREAAIPYQRVRRSDELGVSL